MKNFYVIIIFLLIPVFKNFSQNIFDQENTLKFANYLYDNKDYKYAAEEFERLVFLSPDNSDFKLYLLKSYRLSNNYSSAISAYEKYKSTNNQLNEEFTKCLFLNKDFRKLNTFISVCDSLNPQFRAHIMVSCYLLESKYDSAFLISQLNIFSNNDLSEISEISVTVKYKKPFLASSLSFIIPGAGKIYTDNWKDGMFSLLLVAANSWQAYRGFSQKGVKSIYGWTFASLALGFYLGNIYGSWQSAKKYNRLIDEDIRNKAYNIMLDSF